MELYIIDFERVNELTTSVYDDPDDESNPFVKGKFTYSLSRMNIKEYLKVFTERHITIGMLVEELKMKG